MLIEALALGAALEALALGFAYSRWKLRRSARLVVGKVVSRRSQASGAGAGRVHAPVVGYEVDGVTHRFESSTFGSGCPAVGEELKLLVANDDPSRAVLAEGSGTAMFALVLAVLGTLFLFGGIFAEAVPV